MRYTFYILLSLFICSCNSDDNQETEPNTLIIKHIKDIGVNNERDFYFDLHGRLDLITDTNALPEYNYILSKFEYSDDNKLISSYHTYGTEELFSNLTYEANNISNYEYSTFGSSSDSQILINDNILNYIDILESDFEQDDLNIQLTFNLDNLKYLNQKKITLVNDSNSTWQLTDYEYDINFNMIRSHTTISFDSQVNYTNTLVYDDKKNPIAESMEDYKLALYFLDDFHLIDMSPNNVLSKTNNQGETKIYDYIYNNDNYPISVIITNTVTNEVINTLTYTYY